MPEIVLAATAEAATAEAATVAASTAAAEAAATAAAQQAAQEAARQAAMEAAKQQAIQQGTQQMAQQAATQATTQAATQQGLQQAGQQVGTEALQQGLGQAAQPLPPAGPPGGAPPTTITPPAQPLPPAGQIDPSTLKGLDAAKYDAITGQAGMPTNAFPAPEATVANPVSPPYQAPTTSIPPEITPQTLPGDPSSAAANAYDPSKLIDPSLEKVQAASEYSTTSLGPESIKGGTGIAENPLLKGAKDALSWMGDTASKNKFETGLGLMAAGQYLNQPEEPDKDKYKSKVNMSNFQPSVPVQQPFTRSYEWQGYAVGGPVERMAAMNAVGANTGYPQANLQTPLYSNPAIQRPQSMNVIAPSADAGVDSYTGEPRFAEGGLSEAQRKEYGLSTRKERAARGLSQSYSEEEKRRMQELEKLKSMGDKFDEGIVPRSRTQQLTSPYSAAMTEYARLAKKNKVPVTEMPKTNLGDIDSYMDTPLEAAQGGIMHGAERFAKGGETQYGRPVAATPPGEGHERGANVLFDSLMRFNKSQINQTPMDFTPSWARSSVTPNKQVTNTTAPQSTYTPISYQTLQPQPQPQQQSDMSDFYNYMDQQLGNYGFAAGGIMHGLGGYSDGGRLLKGPGDGVSDSIPAVIGNNQPARLADGEFVIPARIVSELGNGSTEAGARKLYAMMERVQTARKKSMGKKKVAVNSKADKHLPA